MFGLNKITPTKEYYGAAEFHEETNINIIYGYGDPDFLKNYKKLKLKKKQEQEQQRIEQNRKKPQRTRKNNNRKKWKFLLKFINCLKR